MGDPASIYNWRRLDERTTTSGQPSEAELASLGAIGVRRVINLALHTHPKALPDEAASVASLGMEYVHIPVAFDHPTEEDFAAFCRAIETNAVRHVHCIANYRVSAFFYRYRCEVLGMDPAQARMDLDAIWQPDEIWTAFTERRLISSPSPVKDGRGRSRAGSAR